jgi:hypothetical protein
MLLLSDEMKKGRKKVCCFALLSDYLIHHQVRKVTAQAVWEGKVG